MTIIPPLVSMKNNKMSLYDRRKEHKLMDLNVYLITDMVF